MNILITICARGGSKGIPGKNIKLLAGKPLIGYSIELANKFITHYEGKLALSTDDHEIKKIAEKFGLITDYNRPNYLASDKAGKIDVINELLKYEEKSNNTKYDYILDLDVTSPLRTLSDLYKAYKILVSDNNALTIFSVNKANRSPYFNMVEENSSGYYDLVKKNEKGLVMSRQKAPMVYDLNASFYWYRRVFFDKNIKSPITNKSLIYEMNQICFDIDHSIDFDFMSFLLQTNKIKL